MKNRLRDNKGNLLLLLMIFITIWVSNKYGIIDINKQFERGDHFNIITINSVLAGFLFTGLGIIISGLGRKKIDRLEQGGYLDKYYFAIYTAIFFNIVSIISGIIIVFGINLYDVILYCEQISLVIAVIFFIKSMNNLRKIINIIRNSD